jgi:hypothetical protein
MLYLSYETIFIVWYAICVFSKKPYKRVYHPHQFVRPITKPPLIYNNNNNGNDECFSSPEVSSSSIVVFENQIKYMKLMQLNTLMERMKPNMSPFYGGLHFPVSSTTPFQYGCSVEFITDVTVGLETRSNHFSSWITTHPTPPTNNNDDATDSGVTATPDTLPPLPFNRFANIIFITFQRQYEMIDIRNGGLFKDWEMDI